MNCDACEYKQVLKVFDANAKAEKEAMLKRIASKLKVEYLDFKSADDCQMTIELGENLRAQLETVFKILAKNGIDCR